mgnify:FL=1
MEAESFKHLLGKLAARHEIEVAELQARCKALEVDREQAAQAAAFNSEEGFNDICRDVAQREEAKAKQEKSFLSISSLWRSEPQAKQTESGMGLRRILQEGQPKTNLITGASQALFGSYADGNWFVNTLLRYQDWWHRIREPTRHGYLVQLLHSRAFQNMSMFAILANAVWVTYLTDWSLKNPLEGNPAEFWYVDFAFTVFFFIETTLRLIVHRLFFFVNDNAGWNVLDFVLVFISVAELAFSVVSGRETNGTVTYLRVLRLCKFARILRSLKVITAFRELNMMMESFRACLAAMFWSLVLLIFIVFVSALLFAQGVADGIQAIGLSMPPEQQDLVMEHFGSVLKTMLSLYMAVTGGNDWSLYYSILGQLGSFYHFLFIAYTFFSSFAIFNILTGIFVERAVAASMPDREQQILIERRKLLEQATELRDLFSCIDLDCSGFISFDEFVSCMKNPRIVAYMSSVGVSVHDVQHLFKIVANENDEVDIDRFVDGCMAIKGSASALDMQKQLYYMQSVTKTLSTWERHYWPRLLRVPKGPPDLPVLNESCKETL